MQDPAHWKALIQEKQLQKLFNELVDTLSEPLYWHIRSIVMRHDWADDVLQNAFINAWKALNAFRGDSQVYTWLYRIATREALALLKKEKRMQLGDQAFDYRLESDAYFDGDEALEALSTALANLPEKQRIVFQLKYFQDMPFAEMSELLETSVGALKASYHHAKQKIRTELNLPEA